MRDDKFIEQYQEFITYRRNETLMRYPDDAMVLDLVKAHDHTNLPALSRTAKALIPRLKEDRFLVSPLSLAISALAANSGFVNDAMTISEAAFIAQPHLDTRVSLANILLACAQFSRASSDGPDNIIPHDARRLAEVASRIMPTDLEYEIAPPEFLDRSTEASFGRKIKALRFVAQSFGIPPRHPTSPSISPVPHWNQQLYLLN